MAEKSKRSSRRAAPTEPLSETMLARFERLIPEDERAAASEAARTLTLPPAIRLNPAKSAFGTIDNLSARYGWTAAPVEFCASGYRLTEAAVAPGTTVEHRAGAFYIMDSASMLPVSLVEDSVFAGKPLILDMAASPGGKTTHLVSASGDRGLILANDSSAGRIGALRKVLKNYGARNQLVTNFSGDWIGEWFPERFDFILLDAPCSMQSLISIDSHPMRPISEREEAALAERQSRLLTAALNALRPGGQLVYSTCTLSPLEDEAVVDSALKRFGRTIDILDVHRRLPRPAPGISAFGSTTLDQRTEHAVRLWPHRFKTAGFFAALLIKKESAPDASSPPAFRPFTKSGCRLPTAAEERETAAALEDLFGYDAAADVAAKEGTLVFRDEEVWAVPNRVLSEFAELPAKSMGMRIASRRSVGWVADFDWTTHVWGQIGAEKIALDPPEVERWLGGQELQRGDRVRTKGTNLFLTDRNGVPIGIGVVSGERVRSLK